jgi:hypothetical protein
MTTYLTQKEFSAAKGRLTRAQKRGPLDVIAEVRKTIGDWNERGVAWPDDWARWQRAYDDALMAAQREGFGVTQYPPTYELFR